jgi:hypothetical protein
MKKFYLFLFSIIVLHCSINAQDITVNDGDNCFSNDELNFSSSDGGSPPRNIYTGMEGNGFPIRVIWLSGSWRLQIDAGIGWEDTYTSTFASAPNPPHHSVGAWADAPFNCGGASSFQFFGSGTQTALPVELIDFRTTLNRAAVSLHWRTASETNNAGFEVQRSEDGRDFRTLAFVEGHGTTYEQQEYSFTDKGPLSGRLYYYRLRQIDYDGSFEFSKILSLKTGGGPVAAGVFYPNPVSGVAASIDFNLENEGEWTATVFDAAGKALRQAQQFMEAGQQRVQLDISGLQNGLYFVKFENGGEQFYRKLTVK